MRDTAIQMKDFPLAGLLTNVNLQNLAKLSHNLTKPDMQNLSKPDIRPAAHAGMVLGDEVGGAPSAGRIAQQADQFSAASDLGARRWRCLTSRSRAATTNCPVVSPGSLNFSTAFAISCGTRAAIVCDFAFVDFVAITGPQCVRCSTVWQKKKSCKRLTCSTPVTNMVFNTLSTGVAQITKPGSASTLTGPLTTSVIISNEVAMFDHNTPISGRDSLTQKKYQYRFLALSRADAAARPCRISIEATTEQEARRVLAPLFILSLAARLPALEAAQ